MSTSKKNMLLDALAFNDIIYYYIEERPDYRNISGVSKWFRAVLFQSRMHDYTSLMEAVRSGDVSRVFKLIKKGIDINFYYNHALEEAVMHNKEEVVKFLWENGADDHHGENLETAIEEGNLNIFKILLSRKNYYKNIDINYIYSSICGCGDDAVDFLKCFVESGCYIYDNPQIFKIAIQQANIHVIKHLIDMGKRATRDDIILAINERQGEIVKLLYPRNSKMKLTNKKDSLPINENTIKFINDLYEAGITGALTLWLR